MTAVLVILAILLLAALWQRVAERRGESLAQRKTRALTIVNSKRGA